MRRGIETDRRAAKKRAEALPNVPTLAESGFNNLDAAVWFGFVAPAKTPKETLAQLSQYISDAVKSEGVADRLKSQGMFINLFCGAEFGNFCPIRSIHTRSSHASSISSRRHRHAVMAGIKFSFVMAGLVPAIHVFAAAMLLRRGCPRQARA